MPFLIDEPEVFMHPLAQDKLLKSLKRLAKKNQIFITTHSPYILNHFQPSKDKIFILKSPVCNNRVEEIKDLIFSGPRVSIGEITYRAFQIPTVDLHQRLFSYLFEKWINLNKGKRLSDFDYDFFQKEFKERPFQYTPVYLEKGKGKQVPSIESRSLPYIVRNEIDHPEVLKYNGFTEEDLQQSIEIMLDICNSETFKQKYLHKLTY